MAMSSETIVTGRVEQSSFDKRLPALAGASRFRLSHRRKCRYEEDEMGELDDLLSQVRRLGVPGHVHGTGTAEEQCPLGEACIGADGEEPFTALVRAPDRRGEVHVDVMTAFGVLSDLPDDAGFDPMWKELVDIDHGA